MAIPRQVLEAEQKAEALLKAQTETPAATAEQGNTSAEAPVQMDVQQTHENIQTETPQPLETPQIEASNSEVDWQDRALRAEQKYRVLQGKYNAEVHNNTPKPDIETESLKAEIAELRQQVAQAKEAQTATPPTPPQPDADLDQLYEDYGQEMIDGIIAAARKSIKGEVMQEVSSTVENVQRDVRNDSFATKTALLTQQLAQHQIDFDATNNDPLFHEWLSHYDTNTGVQRQAALNNLFQAGNLNAVASMFVEFMGGNSQQQQPTNSFENYVQQPAKSPANDHLPNQKPIFTHEQIAQFYQDWTRGKYSDEEAERIERDIINSTR